MRTFLILSCTLLIVVVGLMAWAAFSGPPPKPTISVRFAGFTNDVAGSRLAAFAVSNASPWAVQHGGHYRIESPKGDRWTNLAEGWVTGSTLDASSWTMVMLPPPTNQSSWRVTLSYRKADSMIFGMASEALIEFQKLGLPTRYRRIGHVVRSDVITVPQ